MTDSPGVRTRRQAAAAKQEIMKPVMNGHANGSAHSRSSESESETHENIFLFWPNIIGATYDPVLARGEY